MAADAITCPGCGSTYDVPPILLEKDELRVRCPACRRRFTLRRPARPAPVAPAPPEAANPAPSAQAPPASPERRERLAKRLAKALVEEILRGKRAKRDEALAAGRLILDFGPEIQRIWRIYEDKVGADTARATSHFRDALNAILADGHEIF